LAIPYVIKVYTDSKAFKCAGLIGGIFILGFTLLMTVYSLRMVVHCIEKTKKFNYDEVLHLKLIAKGSSRSIWKSFRCWNEGLYIYRIKRKLLLVFITIGNQIAFLVILGDSLPPFIASMNQHFAGGRMHWIFLNRYCKNNQH
jgi:hypothetical protein